MKVAIYSRVSRDDKEQDPERQLLKCRDYCNLNEHTVLGEFQEYITGDSMPFTRPAFSKMLELKPEGIIVFSIDRLSRQHPTKVMQLLNQFKNSGVIVISVTEPIFNMESVFAEPMQYFLSWWNNYFLKKLKEDVKSGIEKARREGKQIGRPKCRFNEFRAYHLLVVEGKSLTEVSLELGVSRATLYRFKKVAVNNPGLFIKQGGVSNTGVIETEGGR